MRLHSTAIVQAQLEAIGDILKSNKKDASRLRKARHEVASLFTPFLMEVVQGQDGRIPKSLYSPLQAGLVQLMQQWGVSQQTVDAIVGAVRAVCTCRLASELLKKEYAILACESKGDGSQGRKKKQKRSTGSSASKDDSRLNRKLPIKHYTAKFARLLRAGGEDVRDEYYRFLQAMRHHPADEKHPFTLSRRLCRAIQKEVFHFLRCHVSVEQKVEYEDKALRALINSVWRKLLRAGFNKKLGEDLSRLVVAMAKDEDVVETAFAWAKHSDKWFALEEEGQVTDVLGVEGADRHGTAWFTRDQRFDGDQRTWNEQRFGRDSWPNRDSRLDRDDGFDRERYDRDNWHGHENWHGRADRDQWFDDRNDRHGSPQDDAWRRRLLGRGSNSRGSRSERGSHSRRHKYGRYRDGDSDDTISSVRSWRNRKRDKNHALDVSMEKPFKYKGIFSPVHSSEDLPPLGVHPDDLFDSSDSSEEDSNDTERSQWGRVEMDKEQELELQRELIQERQLEQERLQQLERERLLETQLARERERETELERKGNASRRGSRRQSRRRSARSSGKRSHGSDREDQMRMRDSSRSRSPEDRGYHRTSRESSRRRRPSPEPDGRVPLDRYRREGNVDDSERHGRRSQPRARSNDSVVGSGTRNIYDAHRSASFDGGRRSDRDEMFRQEWG